VSPGWLNFRCSRRANLDGGDLYEITFWDQLKTYAKGTSEATEITIDFTAPDFVTPTREDDLPDRPRQPRSIFDMAHRLTFPTLASQLKPRSPTLPYTKGGSLAFLIPQLVHNRSLALDRVFWRFIDEENIQSFEVSFVITCVQTIDPTEGKLNFVLTSQGLCP
jgi:hypothetical protein